MNKSAKHFTQESQPGFPLLYHFLQTQITNISSNHQINQSSNQLII
jgi:hypothetical protein